MAPNVYYSTEYSYLCTQYTNNSKYMCGIVSYMDKRDAYPVLITGLVQSEYRGNDSAGVALVNKRKLNVCRTKEKATTAFIVSKDICPLFFLFQKPYSHTSTLKITLSGSDIQNRKYIKSENKWKH